jgi:hypothetical protein
MDDITFTRVKVKVGFRKAVKPSSTAFSRTSGRRP